MRAIRNPILDQVPCAQSLRGTGADGASARRWPFLPLILLGKPTDDHGVCLGFADALVTRLGNLPGVDVLPTAAVLNVPVEATAAETASRLGVRFLVHGAIQISKGLRRLSMEMFDTHLQSACFTRKRDLDVIACPTSRTRLRSKSPWHEPAPETSGPTPPTI